MRLTGGQVRWPFWILGAWILLTGCATAPREFSMQAVPPSEERGALWPAAPEMPRYRFAGELLGERNFSLVESRESPFGRFLRTVLGVDQASARPRSLVRPQSGMVDARGRILVTDVGAGGVFVFDVAAGQLSVWTQADEGAGFVAPLGIAEGSGEEFQVTDPGLGRIVRLGADGAPLGSYGKGVVVRPTGIVRDAASGLTYVADTASHDIKVFDDRRQLVRVLGGPGTAPGRFNSPTFLALGGGRLVVSDTLNARVQLLEPDGRPTGQIGQRGIYVGNLVRPKGVAVDSEGNVYVVEGYFDHLLVYDGNGQLLLPIGGTGNAPGKFFLPGGVWSDRSDRIFVADVFNGRVSVFQYLGE